MIVFNKICSYDVLYILCQCAVGTENCILLGYYAASSDNFTLVSGQLIGQQGSKLPLLAA
jgi:hypothetical protein